MGKKLLLFAFVALLVAACNTKKEQEQPVMTISELLDNAAMYVDSTVKIEGTVVHVCAHGGKRLFIEDANGKRIQVEATGDLAQFDATLEKSDIVVTGILRELRIDEAYLQEWEAELAAEAEKVIEEGAEVTEEVAHMEDHPEMAGMDHHVDDPYAKIASYREQIAASENGYVSSYWFEAISFEVKVVEGEVVEEATTEAVEEAVEEEAPVAEQE